MSQEILEKFQKILDTLENEPRKKITYTTTINH